MFGFVSSFVKRMRKRVVSTQGGTAPDSEVPGGKHSKPSGPNEEAYKSPTVSNVDSPNRA